MYYAITFFLWTTAEPIMATNNIECVKVEPTIVVGGINMLKLLLLQHLHQLHLQAVIFISICPC